MEKNCLRKFAEKRTSVLRVTTSVYILALLLMPLTYGFAGWLTNVVALRMTFYPVKFVGIPPYLGWQGIIPRKARKMAERSVELITGRLLSFRELAANVNGRTVGELLGPLLDREIPALIRTVMDHMHPLIRVLTPPTVQEAMIAQARKESMRAFEEIVRKIKKELDDVFHVGDVVYRGLTGPRVRNMVDLFERVGSPELKFIETAGFYFGCVFGALQIVLWLLFPAWWTLPLAGAFVGFATNWLAIRMIFRPLEPRRFGDVEWQGMFLKRQPDVSREMAHFTAEKILNSRRVLQELYRGNGKERVFEIVESCVHESVDRFAGVAKPMIRLTAGPEEYHRIREHAVRRIAELAPEAYVLLKPYLADSLAVEATMRERLNALPPNEFEEILRGAFREDEWLLILVGGVLGAFVGWLQALVVIWAG